MVAVTIDVAVKVTVGVSYWLCDFSGAARLGDGSQDLVNVLVVQHELIEWICHTDSP